MKPTNQLFDIIKSLTPEEEKKFILLSSLQQGEKNYIKLYNFIQKQDSYDEDLVKNHFKNEIFVQHFASEKNQLLHHILKSLHAHQYYRYNHNKSWGIQNILFLKREILPIKKLANHQRVPIHENK